MKSAYFSKKHCGQLLDLSLRFFQTAAIINHKIGSFSFFFLWHLCLQAALNLIRRQPLLLLCEASHPLRFIYNYHNDFVHQMLHIIFKQ